jgi:hypothetical protein
MGLSAPEQTAPAIITPAPEQVREGVTILEDIRKRNCPLSPWTDTRLELLKKYYDQGLSHTLIADQLNFDTKSSFSRNAVIGKCMRLGFEKRLSTLSLGGHRKLVGARRAYRDRGLTQRFKLKDDRPAFVEIDLPSPDHLGIGIFDLQKHHCRFISDGTYCGQNVSHDSSWCPFHRRLVYQRPTKPEKLAA